MKSNYKKLGDYIKKVDVKNKGLQTENLQGLSMTKEFRKTTSNIVGTDLRNYKIIAKNQFACDFMSVIRVHKLPVVLHNSNELIIVSPAYTVFKIKDETLLDPEYLMMWFRRDEFDRYADFRCDSAIRGGFKWEELCEVELPVPSLATQKEIVKEYHTITKRIQLKEQLNEKLEENAQALYKHWLVDFEFPTSAAYAASVGKPNIEGKPYKSSGGVMVYIEELDEDIPDGWKVCSLYDTANFINGSSFKKQFFCSNNEGLPIIKIDELKNGVSSKTNFTIQKLDEKYRIRKGELLYSWSGNPETSLETFKWLNNDAWLNQHIFKIVIDEDWQDLIFVYYLLQNLKTTLIRLAKGKQTTGLGHITVADMKKIMIAYPSKLLMKHFIHNLSPFYNLDTLQQNEILVLKQKLSLLLSKMATVGSEEEIINN